MAKIVVRLPEPKTEYDVSNQKQINRAIQTIVEQLNSTYLQDLKEDNERYAWFKGGNGGDC
jgi:GTPase involved in cell partitioning and DNA repair